MGDKFAICIIWFQTATLILRLPRGILGNVGNQFTFLKCMKHKGTQSNKMLFSEPIIWLDRDDIFRRLHQLKISHVRGRWKQRLPEKQKDRFLWPDQGLMTACQTRDAGGQDLDCFGILKDLRLCSFKAVSAGWIFKFCMWGFKWGKVTFLHDTLVKGKKQQKNGDKNGWAWLRCSGCC